MAAIEVNGTNVACTRCGNMYGKRKGFFPVSYSPMYKGTGYLGVCKKCIEEIYSVYLSQCKDPKMAVRQVCRKLDLYWNESIYDTVEKRNTTRSLMSGYLQKVNNNSNIGKSYDDTLLEEGTLWGLSGASTVSERKIIDAEEEEIDIEQDIIDFWGSGLPAQQYLDLEQRRAYWMKKLYDGKTPEELNLDAGTEGLIRQICNLETDINRDKAAGRPISNNVNTLNAILGSANLKPTQKKDSTEGLSASTPYGVWIKKIENTRPISEPSAEFKDVDGIVKYITTWFLGHLCKMMGVKNSYCKLYEEEIAKLRVEYPESGEEDDETLFNDVFAPDGEEND